MIRKFVPYIFWIYILLLIIGDIIPDVHIDQKVGILFLKFRLDHWLHFFSYLGFSSLFFLWRYSKLEDYSSNIPFFKVWQLFIFAAATEVLQFAIPGRSANIKDFLCNCIGIIFGMVSIYVLKTLIFRFSIRKLYSKSNVEPSVIKVKKSDML
jgi:hypothetical protein